MRRIISDYFDTWLGASDKKPIVLRGARQTGKTWVVRNLAERHNHQLVELNFERFPEFAEHFMVNSPREILKSIEADLEVSIDPKRTILFLDEIQAKPELLTVLRWFYEDIPELPVIAAGSLLEFALAMPKFSMPVGRLSYVYLEPMSFFEFLMATNNHKLLERLEDVDISTPLNPRIHDKALTLYLDYCIIGGMPEVVASWQTRGELSRCFELQRNLLATFRDDFNKYIGRMNPDFLNATLSAIPDSLGNKFTFSRVGPGPQIKKAVELLSCSRLCSHVHHTSGNGLPLGAEGNRKFMKLLLLDIGLVASLSGMSKMKRSDLSQLILANRGGLAEQFVGQQIRAFMSLTEDPRLFYWQRVGGRQGEIDYVIQHRHRIIPVEVKSGASGSMKSLHQFMHDKELDLAVRVDSNPISKMLLEVKTTQGDPSNYTLLSIPFYLMERLPALLDST